MKWILLLFSHSLVAVLGVALGIYILPILTQPVAPSLSSVQSMSNNAVFSGTFQRDRQDSDFLHWGEGAVSISEDTIGFIGELAPGPDYRLYLSPSFVETEVKFNEFKDQMIQVGSVKTFDRFTLSVPESIDVNNFNTVIIWCETFSQFITSARYQ
ncbi:DM13 domain-containing protein [Vibrio mexicanus]|uniref:DM13 domain-containing protein n=1 Tax=Vibrio mexicanus TaxID=1004326 RepID=UPI00063CD34C|nr:DM13 domain-containing protein [Vibrio mexicanus]